MAIGSSKGGVLGAGFTVQAGSITFNTTGTWTVPCGVKKVSITGTGSAGNPGNPGNPGSLGQDRFAPNCGTNFQQVNIPWQEYNGNYCNHGSARRKQYTSGAGGAGGAGGGFTTYGNYSYSPNPGGAQGTYRGGFGGHVAYPFFSTQFRCRVVPGGTVNLGGSGNSGQSGSTGTNLSPGAAGNAGAAGNPGSASSGLGYTFPGGAAGNAGAAGNGGTGSTGGSGASGGGGGGATFSYNVTYLTCEGVDSSTSVNYGGGGSGGGGRYSGGSGSGGPGRGGAGSGAAVGGNGTPAQPGIQGATTSPSLATICVTPLYNTGPCRVTQYGEPQAGGYGPASTFYDANGGHASGLMSGGGGGGGSGGPGGGAGGGGSGYFGNAANPGNPGGGGGSGGAAPPSTTSGVPVTPKGSYPISVAPGGQVKISWNAQ